MVSILGQLTEKSWLPNASADDENTVPSMAKEKVGLRVFLASVTVLFTLIAISYTGRMTLPDWRSVPYPGLLWVNTVILILSSVALQWARTAARDDRIRNVKTGLLVGGALSLVFLLGQFWVSLQLADLGYFAASNPANAFFYMITGVHAVHLTGGLVAWIRTSLRVWRGSDAARVALSVELCSIYWHFLLVVWLVLFVMMVTTEFEGVAWF